MMRIFCDEGQTTNNDTNIEQDNTEQKEKKRKEKKQLEARRNIIPSTGRIKSEKD